MHPAGTSKIVGRECVIFLELCTAAMKRVNAQKHNLITEQGHILQEC